MLDDYTLTVVQDQVEYPLIDADPEQWIAFNDDAQMDDTTWVWQTTRDQLRVRNRNWRSAASATPLCWYWAAPQTVGLYPPASASGATISFSGPRHEPRLVDDTDTPILDEDFHEGICLFAAWHHGKLYARGAEREIVAAYLAEGEDYVNRVKESMATKEAQLVVRRVQRSPQEYSNTGRLAPVIFWPGN